MLVKGIAGSVQPAVFTVQDYFSAFFQSEKTPMDKIIISPLYDCCRYWIDAARSDSVTWEEIFETGTADWLDGQKTKRETRWPLLTVDQWKEIVEAKKTAEEASKVAGDTRLAATDDILGREIDADIRVSLVLASCWQIYRNRLINAGWKIEAIATIERSSEKTLKRMSRMTQNQDAIKGLVVGHVQSGKTANMAGLMAIGADNGYNVFIVLSGIIDNLRHQNQARLLRDLQTSDVRHNLSWRSLEHLSRRSPVAERASNLTFGDTCTDRFMTVSLKNATRLKNLLEWLKHDTNKLAQMRIVIIDDEADQAGINLADAVANEERRGINNLIVQLTKVKAKAVNYVSYTATPYANFLNEAYPESLYPKDFIMTIPQSNEHFGPAQIFGLEGRDQDGLDIIRTIGSEDVEKISDIHRKEELELPDSFRDALVWFLCAAATKRYRRILAPSSMLIHTSQRVACHENIARAVETWLRNPGEDIFKRCENVWKSETDAFSLENFRTQFSDYGLSEELLDYPVFEDIREGIANLLEEITHINIDQQGDPRYHKGIHLCIDNSVNNGINEENQMVRLVYPPAGHGSATAFIIVGGSTLSRGLTLEGLVSTYFLRDSNQMDTLMQMGRWFGYRRGYELLPRIWMTAGCLKKFRYLAITEMELREELKNYMQPPFTDPKEFGPRVKNSPALSWLRPTAKNRMQNHEPVDIDYSGANSQTTMFCIGKEILEKNIAVTEGFLAGLPVPERSASGNALVWKDTDFEQIAGYLEQFEFSPRARLFGDINAFLAWYREIERKGGYKKWNVVVAGIKTVKGEPWMVKGFPVNKVERSRLNREIEDGSVAIGVLRAPRDLLADAPPQNTPDKDLDNNTIQRLRKEAGLEYTPQLLIYRISRESKAERGKTMRSDLDVPADIIGISLWIPGVRDEKGNPNNFAKRLQVRIPDIARDNDSDTPEI